MSRRAHTRPPCSGFGLRSPTRRAVMDGMVGRRRRVAWPLLTAGCVAFGGHLLGEWQYGQVMYGLAGEDEGSASEAVRSSEWRGNDGVVALSFDATGRLVGKTYIPAVQRSLSPAAV